MVVISHLVHYDTLLENATYIFYRMRQLFCYKMWQLLQNVTILLQKATLLLNATFITKCASTIVNDVKFEVVQLLLWIICHVLLIINNDS